MFAEDKTYFVQEEEEEDDDMSACLMVSYILLDKHTHTHKPFSFTSVPI